MKSIDSEKILERINDNNKSVFFNKVEIIGDLDFTTIKKTRKERLADTNYRSTINNELVFKNCIFKGRIKTYYENDDKVYRTIFKNQISFEGSILLDSVDFREAKFYKKVSFENVRFSEITSFKDTKFYNYVDFNNSYFENDTNFINAKFYNLTNFDETYFLNNVSFDNTKHFRIQKNKNIPVKEKKYLT